MFTDYHNHCLPVMDDGSKSVEMSIEMLTLLREQGVDRVVATPHYHRHRQSVGEFLDRRQASYDSLQKAYREMPILLGAEVALERGLSEDDMAPELCIEGSRYILLEMPYQPYKDWMLEEIYNITVRFNLVPIIAHIDRCTDWYSAKDMAALLSLKGAVFQINYEALAKRKTLKFVVNLIQEDYPVIFGTDTHNMGMRAPNAHLFKKILYKKLDTNKWLRIMERNEKLLTL